MEFCDAFAAGDFNKAYNIIRDRAKTVVAKAFAVYAVAVVCFIMLELINIFCCPMTTLVKWIIAFAIGIVTICLPCRVRKYALLFFVGFLLVLGGLEVIWLAVYAIGYFFDAQWAIEGVQRVQDFLQK